MLRPRLHDCVAGASCCAHEPLALPPQVLTPDKASYQAMVEQLLGPALAAGQPQQQVAEQLPAQLAGLLPRDVCGVVADAVAGAAAEALAAAERRQQCADSGSNGDAAEAGSDSAAALQVQAQHVEQALARVKARTATEIGAPQVGVPVACCRVAEPVQSMPWLGLDVAAGMLRTLHQYSMCC
jgi:hypothetical protein